MTSFVRFFFLHHTQYTQSVQLYVVLMFNKDASSPYLYQYMGVYSVNITLQSIAGEQKKINNYQ